MTDWHYLIQDHMGYTISVWSTRHDAAFAKYHYHDCNDYEIIPVRAVAAFDADPKLAHDKHGWYQ